MLVLSGADLVLPDRVVEAGTLVIDGDRIAEIHQRSGSFASSSATSLAGHCIVPGFIDVHVHGVEGVDTLDGGNAVAEIAARLPRYGVTAFCPTTVACGPQALKGVLAQVSRARSTPSTRAARVLPAHLESNFINPDYRGAQPLGCLRSPRPALAATGPRTSSDEDFNGADILREIEIGGADVGIVTIAPELDGGLDLTSWLAARGCRVSLGHSAAAYDEAKAAIALGARSATHLFNRMPPLHHRAPGLVGAVLGSDEVAAEIICDGFHVHPAIVRAAVAAKRPSRICAITDGTAAAGLAEGARTRLGGQPIAVGPSAAFLGDGTLAGSTLTMNRAFEVLVRTVGVSRVEAATMCATTPARELGLSGYGVLARDAFADLVVLDRNFSVVQTYIGGRLVHGPVTNVVSA